ncbi:hypothetical protein pb186bvf_017331 [Paramecium bursaria]
MILQYTSLQYQCTHYSNITCEMNELNKLSILYSEQNTQIFKDLVKQYGVGRWSAIADALKLHGLEIKYPQGLGQIYENLQGGRKNLTATIGLELLTIMLDFKMKVRPIAEKWYEVSGKKFTTHEIYGKFKKYLKVATKAFIKMFIKQKLKYYEFFQTHYTIRNLKNMLKIINATHEDQQLIQLQQSCKSFIEFLKLFVDDIQVPREELYAKYRVLYNRRSATQIMDDAIYIVCITQILQGYQFPYTNLTVMCPRLHPTDINGNNTSPLYKLLQKSRNAPKMYNQFFEAIDNHANGSEFTYQIGEKKKPKQLVEKEAKIVKKLPTPLIKIPNPLKTSRSAFREKRFAQSLIVQALKDQQKLELKEKKNQEKNLQLDDISVDSEFIEYEFKIMEDPKLLEHIEKRKKYMAK